MEIEAINHTDPGNIRLTIVSVLTPEAADQTISSIVRGIDQRIRASGDGVQIFEEGIVAKLTDIAQPPNKKGLDSCCYAMHFLDSVTAGCARMHFHPGERQLIVTIPKGSVFNVNSLSPIEVINPINADIIKTRIAPDTVLEKNRYDTQISGPAQIIVQIPDNVSHQFSSANGRAAANSFHPNETREKEIVGAGIESGTMQGHTTPFVSFCAMEAPHGAVDLLSKEQAVAALLKFKREAKEGNLFGPHEIAKMLFDEHQIRTTPRQVYVAMAKLFEADDGVIVAKPSIVDLAGRTRSSALLATAEAVPLIAEKIKNSPARA